MNKVKVRVKDKTILELQTDAKKGDIIDLRDVVEIDTSYIEMLIESKKDEVYEKKLSDYKRSLDILNQSEKDKLQSRIDSLEESKNNDIKIKEAEIYNKFRDEINQLKNKNNSLIQEYETKINLLNLENENKIKDQHNEDEHKYSALLAEYDNFKKEFQTQLNLNNLMIESEYKSKLSNLSTSFNSDLSKKELEISELKNKLQKEKNEEFNSLKDRYEKELKVKEDMINQLQRAKASINVKQTGEDLESWCDNEMTSYMQNGLLNCTWIKDNKVVKEEGEVKGSKADYIFTVYSDNNHSEENRLTSVCLDMKDENPDSTNKKSNADYYKALEKNREKKNCEYSILVSNLETDKPNSLPIFKVREYENMYVVRPAYMIVFLNMLASLTNRFVNLIKINDEKNLELKSKTDIIENFNAIKNTYLDKPLQSLEKDINEISKKADTIKSCADSINSYCENIRDKYINQIKNKIDNFELNLNRKVIKKLDE